MHEVNEKPLSGIMANFNVNGANNLIRIPDKSLYS